MIVTRFAPSPTGYLHLGHAYAALFAHEWALAKSGRFLLRLEDIDRARSRPHFAAAVLDDLRWLDLAWAEPVLVQSERLDAYSEALSRLDGEGLLYPCFCTRGEIAEEVARAVEAPHGPEGPHYPGTCRALSSAERKARVASGFSYALRLDVRQAAMRAGALAFEEEGEGPHGEHGSIGVDATLFGDVVLARKDTPASYHLAAVVDDAFQGVTLVTRGNDLFPATHIQRVLQALLGYSAPAYAHHKLILDGDGRKFSKRDHSATLKSLRAMGETPAHIRARLGLTSR
ncbi:MAG TPA: tRNA glutamyl-Q(34) synthetase GluQRS [Rhizomicrobium sp.]|nr:tRNA glutamyl-Q(34) synthetase GluQRS [Rhizomicrobium sp.]